MNEIMKYIVLGGTNNTIETMMQNKIITAKKGFFRFTIVLWESNNSCKFFLYPL